MNQCRETTTEPSVTEFYCIHEKGHDGPHKWGLPKLDDEILAERDRLILQNAEMRKEIAIAIPFLKSRLAWKPTKPFEDVINTLEKFLDKPNEEVCADCGAKIVSRSMTYGKTFDVCANGHTSDETVKRVGQKCGFWTAGVCCQEVEPCPVHGVSPGASL